MGWMRVGWLWLPLLVNACGGKAGSHGAAAAAGTGGDAVKEPGDSGGMPAEPAAGGARSMQPDETGGSATAGESASAGGASGGEGGAPADPLTFCDENPHQFCADFDGAVYDEGWLTDIQGNGSLAPFTNDSVSAPRSLLSKFEWTNYEVASAILDVTLPPGAQGYVLTFDLFIDKVPLSSSVSPYAEVTIFRVVNGDSSTGLSVVFDNQDDRLWFDTSNSYSGYSPGILPKHQWLHVELSVTYGSLGTGTFDIKLGDAEPVHWENTNVAHAPGPIQLRLGLETTRANYEASAMYDNVTLDLMP